MLKVNDIVRIKREPKGSINEFARVTVVKDIEVHVSNTNMPYCGTLCRWFKLDEVEFVK